MWEIKKEAFLLKMCYKSLNYKFVKDLNNIKEVIGPNRIFFEKRDRKWDFPAIKDTRFIQRHTKLLAGMYES